MTDLSSYTDADLEKELRELTGRIAKAIERREDIIDEMVRRGWPTARSLTGFRVMAHRLAEELGVPVPEIPAELPVRNRDESWWWTNVQSTALLIKAFLPKESRTEEAVKPLVLNEYPKPCGDADATGAPGLDEGAEEL